MYTTILTLLTIGTGFCVALQASANSRFRSNLDSPSFATFLSICGTITTASLVMLFLRPTVPTWQQFRGTEWWNWIGGPLGALIVLSGASLARELGAATFMALVVAGQLTCSLILDHYSLMGLAAREATPGRIIGVVLVILGVLAIKYL